MADDQRLRGILASLLRETGEVPGAAPARLSPGLLDSAAEAVSSTLDRWTHAAPLRRLLGGVERDVLTRPGEWVALEATLGLAGKRRGPARFLLDGEVAAEARVGAEGQLRAMIRAPEPGRYRIDVELANRAPTAHGHLHVVEDRPLVLVDAALLLDPDQAPLPTHGTLLRSLDGAGLELAYFDLAEKQRSAAIHEAMRALALPRAAILSYAAEAETVENLGLDLAPMFGVAAVHRLRSAGVPVCAVLTERFVGDHGRLGPVAVLEPRAGARLLDEGLAGLREQAEQFLAAHAASDPISWRLDQSTGSRRVAGNALVTEFDNRRARERVFALIEAAESSIHMQVYILRPSVFAERLTVALIRRARAGVQVRLMVDALYSDQEVLGRTNPLMLSLEAEPNIDVLALHPIETRHELDIQRLKQRDHRKLLILDGARAIVSGRNAADEYYLGFDEVPIHDHTNHQRIPWLDAHVEVEGPLVSEIQRCFVDTWAEQGGAAIDDPGALSPKLAAAGESAARFVVHHGLVDANGLAMYEALLELAEDHVIIVNDFPIVSTLERAIARLLARGVHVQLLTGNAAARRSDGSLFPAPIHRTLFEYMVKARFEPLMRAGVEVYEFETAASPQIVARGGSVRPYVHAKIMAVDGRVCTIGSANLDATASFWESEANAVIEDPRFTAALEDELRTMIAGSYRIDPSSEAWKRERNQRAVVAKLWPAQLYS